ncbi:hypothetical protein PHSY_001568 [Pseudozyma hubeiensis SY62]|uniref:Uncharacterized protein n=1 Tax=Pseudozyma hubeiensis (strain SY62) TaxID=1305764 RepID=R9NZ24_PSEHS|nr:hypothetical protein PHSY_001568 [Pseudozyma hubeiensis SY62]GAC93999.1 hypothetical protein PHSY_001568 [Pseudozyma hubeiensis SY62]
MRTRSAEQARLLRALKGYPPIGSSADADQLSDLEESIEVGKYQMVRFGERYIVQIGRRRTMREEELSNEEDDGRRAGISAVDAGLSIGPEGGVLTANEDASLQAEGGGNEGATGPFVGGHTGHAQAEFNQRQIAEAERRARDAEAGANRAAAAAEAARSQAERQAAFQEEEDAVDLDGDVEDLDEGDDEVDFD